MKKLALILFLLAFPAHADLLSEVHAAEDRSTWAPMAADDPRRRTVESTDCNGFALRYRARLLAKGIPAEDMAVMNVPHKGQRHAVLLVRYQGKLMVLDNTAWEPYPWERPSGRFNVLYTGEPIPEWIPAWWK